MACAEYLRVGDENAIARMMSAAIVRWRQLGSLEGGHFVPMSVRPQRQAPLGWMEFAGITCLLAAFAPAY